MARVTRRPLAAGDILDIWDHIAEDSVEQADRWVDKLDEKFRLIATQPLMGRARNELAANVRSFPFGRYIIFYEPIDNETVTWTVVSGGGSVNPVTSQTNQYGLAWTRYTAGAIAGAVKIQVKVSSLPPIFFDVTVTP